MTALAEPATLVAGDSWAWSRPDLAQAWPAADGWALRYHLAPEAGGASVQLDAVAFAIALAPAATATYAAGRWAWRAVVHNGGSGARQTVDSGVLVIEPDPASAQASDGRSWAERTLAAVNAVLEGRATADHEAYTIEGRSVTRIPLAELVKWQGRLEQRVRVERGGSVMQTMRVAFKP